MRIFPEISETEYLVHYWYSFFNSLFHSPLPSPLGEHESGARGASAGPGDFLPDAEPGVQRPLPSCPLKGLGTGSCGARDGLPVHPLRYTGTIGILGISRTGTKNTGKQYRYYRYTHSVIRAKFGEFKQNYSNILTKFSKHSADLNKHW